MKLSTHFIKRMNNRGISAEMVNIAFIFGEDRGDKIILSRKITKELMQRYSKQKNILTKIYDKGGVTLVSKDDTLITVYNSNFNNKRALAKR